MVQVTDEVAALFCVNDHVKVRFAEPPGHVRIPHYCRGQVGVIERMCGTFPNPEELAYGRRGLPAQPLYRVRFAIHELWANYVGNLSDCVEVEIYQHWLQSMQ